MCDQCGTGCGPCKPAVITKADLLHESCELRKQAGELALVLLDLSRNLRMIADESS